ncbi:MAG: glycosyltransferase family 2 protein [Dehalococcoidia bacterium]|nr:MAG: glycosyltransferase family 2 protein [Dehalococcoidia bacterium]
MGISDLTLSVVIPTYQREKVLIETLEHLLACAMSTRGFLELIIIDQTLKHQLETEERLSTWNNQGMIKWLRLGQPHLTRSMNIGLTRAQGDIVLFVDDDIIPDLNLLNGHLNAYRVNPAIWAVVGQVLQPGEKAEDVLFIPHGRTLWRYLDFPFRSKEGMYMENVSAGNLSVKQKEALLVGGFDENFTPPVAFRFETEFAKRLGENGGKIWFEPKASIRHLRVNSGGTRSLGSHLNSISPIYGVGDYYYALRCGKGWEKVWYILKRPFREIRTMFHLKNPWWVPVKFIGEIRAIWQALHLSGSRPKLLKAVRQAEKK